MAGAEGAEAAGQRQGECRERSHAELVTLGHAVWNRRSQSVFGKGPISPKFLAHC